MVPLVFFANSSYVGGKKIQLHGLKKVSFSSLPIEGYIEAWASEFEGLEANGGGGDRQKDGQTDGHLEIQPCVQPEISPLEPLPEKRQGWLGNQLSKVCRWSVVSIVLLRGTKAD